MAKPPQSEFAKKAKVKGWSGQELAARWELSAKSISRIGKNPSKVHWDALAGLPVKQ